MRLWKVELQARRRDAPDAQRRAAIVELIGATTTKTGLKVECALDERTYEEGIKVSDAEMRLGVAAKFPFSVHPHAATRDRLCTHMSGTRLA